MREKPSEMPSNINNEVLIAWDKPYKARSAQNIFQFSLLSNGKENRSEGWHLTTRRAHTHISLPSSAKILWHKLEMPVEIWLETVPAKTPDIKHFSRFELKITNSDFIPEWIFYQLPTFTVNSHMRSGRAREKEVELQTLHITGTGFRFWQRL